VRKLGVPGQPELAMGAVASGGSVVFNEPIVRELAIDQATIDAVLERERALLQQRERTYRGDRPKPSAEGKTVILIDDGLATGASMRAAVAALKQQGAGGVVVAVPVAPPEAAWQLAQQVDTFVCPRTPEPFFGVGQWYENFSQVSDQQVTELLQKAWTRQAQAEG
jgi:putative phosphoribosyl transferase